MNMRPLMVVLALGTTVLAACKEDTPVALAAEASAPVAAAPVEQAPAATPAPVVAAKPAHKPRPAYRSQTVAAADPVPATQPAPKVICNDCGTITAMSAIKQEGEASGAGAVLGAIAGGLLGSQIGNGRGSQAAAAAGAVAGGVGGHMAEKKIREHTAYRVTVKMDSGYTRTVTVPADMAGNFSVGSPVRVDNDGNLSLR